jgi:hypothetical protein
LPAHRTRAGGGTRRDGPEALAEAAPAGSAPYEEPVEVLAHEVAGRTVEQLETAGVGQEQ